MIRVRNISGGMLSVHRDGGGCSLLSRNGEIVEDITRMPIREMLERRKLAKVKRRALIGIEDGVGVEVGLDEVDIDAGGGE